LEFFIIGRVLLDVVESGELNSEFDDKAGLRESLSLLRDVNPPLQLLEFADLRVG